jgi:hypothetical protein
MRADSGTQEAWIEQESNAAAVWKLDCTRCLEVDLFTSAQPRLATCHHSLLDNGISKGGRAKYLLLEVWLYE